MIIAKTISEELFGQYLNARELKSTYELLDGKKQPDYLVSSQRGNVICEVKEFSNTAQGMYKPIREKINQAQKQFKEYKNRKVPCVLILSNPNGAPIPLNQDLILGAMYGDLTISVPINQSSSFDEDVPYYGRNGRMRNFNTTISAVAILEEVQTLQSRSVVEADRRANPHFYDTFRSEIGRLYDLLKENLSLGEKVLRLRIYHNFKAIQPLNPLVFCGAEDVQCRFNHVSGQYEEVKLASADTQHAGGFRGRVT